MIEATDSVNNMPQDAVFHPSIPYVGAIESGLHPDDMILIEGMLPQIVKSFAVDIVSGPDVTTNDIPLHFKMDFIKQCIVRNHYKDQQWGEEELGLSVPLQAGKQFLIMILCKPDVYKIALNGAHNCTFNHRFPLEKSTYLSIRGDIIVTSIKYVKNSTGRAPNPVAQCNGNTVGVPQFHNMPYNPLLYHPVASRTPFMTSSNIIIDGGVNISFDVGNYSLQQVTFGNPPPVKMPWECRGTDDGDNNQ